MPLQADDRALQGLRQIFEGLEISQQNAAADSVSQAMYDMENRYEYSRKVMRSVRNWYLYGFPTFVDGKLTRGIARAVSVPVWALCSIYIATLIQLWCPLHPNWFDRG